MSLVTGIGGVFFRARDPEALQAWYEAYLGVGGPHMMWRQSAGDTVFAPFSSNTDYFPPDRQWMINLRVSDLDALVAELKEAGIAVFTNPDWDSPELGRFARIHDPEGNPVELWQPA